MAQHDTFAWLSLGAAYLGVIGLAGGVIRYGSQVRDKRRGQARHVFAWFEPAVGGSRFVVRNRSEWPVSQVVIDVTVNGGHANFNVGLIDCGEDYFEPWPETEVEGARWLAAACWFTDASGRRWYRSTNGSLQRWRSWSPSVLEWQEHRPRLRVRTRIRWYRLTRDARRRYRAVAR